MMRPKAHLIINAKSGVGKGSTLIEEFERICEELNFELVEYVIHCPDELEHHSKIAVNRALGTDDVVIAAGGDGTIRSVAQVAYGKSIRFAVVPFGTFNFFARAHNIPEDHAAAFHLALTGLPRPVRLGLINGQVFLINASLGLYAKAIKEREHNTSRFGRYQLVVIISTIFSLFSKHPLLKVDLLIEDKLHTRYTPMIFIGNNALQLGNLALNVAHCMKRNLLAVVMMKPITKSKITRIILRGIFKTLEDEESVESFCADSLTIHTRQSSNMVALDGEIMKMNSPLNINALPGALNMVLPTHAPLSTEPSK